jgi:hypothetical protein
MLFEELGIQPEPRAIGTLGDILENFALHLLSGRSNSSMTVEELAIQLEAVFASDQRA